MIELVKPYGSDIIKPLLLTGNCLSETIKRVNQLPTVLLSDRELGDVIMLGIGAFTPLSGFMGYDDWYHVCTSMKLANGLFWPIPITLSVNIDNAATLKLGDEIALVADGQRVAIMTITEKYTINKLLECHKIFATDDMHHPGVKMVLKQGDINIAGPINVLIPGISQDKYASFMITPLQMRQLFKERGWQKICAFQTRNPLHRAHEYLIKIALEVSDGVLLHSILGKVCDEDIPGYICVEAIKALIDKYFVKNRLIQAGIPLSMRYGGPREALLHALCRQNYGCSHIIIGRDHAGIGHYYPTDASQRIFDEIPQNSLQIQALKLDWAFWCMGCDGMATTRTCPHNDKYRIRFSGTQLRDSLYHGKKIPKHFSRPEVVAILKKYYAGK